MSPTPLTIVGSTGLTGSAALRSLLSSPAAFAITALTRRDNPATSSTPGTTYANRVLPDAAVAAAADEPLASPGGVYVSCLGTTRADAGSVENQKKIDYELNKLLAERARRDGADTVILVSTTGANAASWFAYPAMKGQLEDDIKAMGFANTVILRPATLLYDGARPAGHVSRTAEWLFVGGIRCLRSIGVPTGAIGIDGDDVGAAIAQLAANPPKGETTLYDADMVKLATEFRASLQKETN